MKSEKYYVKDGVTLPNEMKGYIEIIQDMEVFEDDVFVITFKKSAYLHNLIMVNIYFNFTRIRINFPWAAVFKFLHEIWVTNLIINY